MTSSADFDPIPVDALLSATTVTELFRLSRESWKLDYKEDFDPSANRDVVELTKDLIAMANTAGGYIVIGVADDGTCKGLSESRLNSLDEAILRKQIEKYLGKSLPLFLNKPILKDGKCFAIVTVVRPRDALFVFQKDGQYVDPRDPSGRRMVRVFSSGDVFVRHGSASERWNQEDVDSILARLRDAERQRLLEESSVDASRLLRERQALQPDDLRALLHADESTFEKLVRRLTRGGNE